MPIVAAALLLLQLVSAPLRITGTVLDSTGSAVAGARVGVPGASTETGADGTFAITAATLPVALTVSAPGFSDRVLTISSSTPLPISIVIEPRGITAALTVSASAEGTRVSSPAAVTVLDRVALSSAPALTLDEQLRSVPGFGLFRRSSSRVANPTTQGVTLRGLAASGASRATVVADGIPLADPFGGWVYWDRVPAAAVERVEVARGGASDVYGSDATGGAIRIETSASGEAIVVEGGTDRTARVSAFAGRNVGPGNLRAGAEQFTTDGYVVVAPESRGPIDVRADSRHTTLFAAGSAPVFSKARVDLRAGYFSEDRGNGTPYQMNSTDGRDVSGALSGSGFGGFWSARGVFTWQEYDQTFSAVAANRESERPTSAQHVNSSSRGAALEFIKPAGAWTIVTGITGRQVNADLTEQLAPEFAGAPTVSAVQQSAGVVTQASWAVSPRATMSAGLRLERWRTSSARGGDTPDVGTVLPRLSFSFRADPSITIRASVQDSYRVPTMNELYRAFRVGNVETLANSQLTPEKSLGGDVSVLVTRGPALLRATAFVARVDDAIVNVTESSTPALIVRQRANASRIQASGFELESELRAGHVWAATASGTYGRSTFDGGELDGLRVPQVPRVQLSAGVRATWPRANAGIDWRYTGRQFDDDRNQFELRAAAITDARAAWTMRRGLDLFVAVENVFDVEQDVGRTPLRTIGLARSARVGIRFARR